MHHISQHKSNPLRQNIVINILNFVFAELFAYNKDKLIHKKP